VLYWQNNGEIQKRRTSCNYDFNAGTRLRALEVIRTCFKTVKIKMSELIVNAIGSTESIKSYLMNSNCVVLFSIHAIEKN
jgi:hypothetical protein